MGVLAHCVPMKEDILKAAERRARQGGYHGFSFRELAEDVGIKSSSVHHHFPTKAALMEVLAERYLERTRVALGDPERLSARSAIKRVADLFLFSNENEDRMCLCGMLAAEADALPESLLPKVTAYFELIERWLATAFKHATHAPKPIEVVAALEGAILIARARRDPGVLRSVVSALQARARE
jgi:TetR/AcrR family transcriptional regulator, transcriptional repressor for nem operon